jgi:hypothetical protein
MGTQDEKPGRPGALTEEALQNAAADREPTPGDADFIVTKEYRAGRTVGDGANVACHAEGRPC